MRDGLTALELDPPDFATARAKLRRIGALSRLLPETFTIDGVATGRARDIETGLRRAIAEREAEISGHFNMQGMG